MADQAGGRRAKRRLRAPAETVRERAEKAQTEGQKPVHSRRIRGGAGKIARPVGNLGHWFNRQPFRFIGRVIFPRYFRDSWRELRLVTWPNRRESRRLTFAVLAFAVVFGAAIALVDYGLDHAFKAILLK